MKYALAVCVLAPTLYSAPPLSLTAHYLDVGAGGQSYALAVDGAGNVFAASTAYEPSGRPVIRIIKTGMSWLNSILARTWATPISSRWPLPPMRRAI